MVEVEMKVEDISTYFFLVTSYFSLSFDFSPLFFIIFFNISEN